MKLVVVAAVADNGVIGAGNTMPWRLRSDFVHFRSVTTGKPVVMGRKTFLSIGKPLANRTNIVITRDPAFAAPGIVVAPSVETGLALARADALRRGVDEIIIGGGGEIYARLMDQADKLVITHVHESPDGDAHFPAIDPAVWHETSRARKQPGEGDTAAFSFATYEKIR